ncbi:MAG: thioredoxin domain-containing protein [Pseudomonadota bacterium]
MPLLTFTRRSTLAAMALALLAACGNANGDSASSASGAALNDMVMGDPDAPVTLIEYASVTCGACYQFHFDVMPTIKERFVDTGQVKYIFREFPTAPAQVAVAGFAVARCAGPDKYFDVVDDLFVSQPGIIEAARQGVWIQAIQAVAARHGIEGEEAFEACVNDRDIRQTIADIFLAGQDLGVDATPTLFLQGEKLEPSIRSRTPDGLSALIEAELTALGISVDTAASAPATPAESAQDDNLDTEEAAAEPETVND